MTPTELYKAILASITQVRNVRAANTTRRTLDGTPHANDTLLDEMARNAAQVVLGLIDEAAVPAAPFTSSMVDTVCERCKQPASSDKLKDGACAGCRFPQIPRKPTIAPTPVPAPACDLCNDRGEVRTYEGTCTKCSPRCDFIGYAPCPACSPCHGCERLAADHPNESGCQHWHAGADE